MKNPKQNNQSPENRKVKLQQIVFSILALFMILSMVISLFVNI